MGFLEDELSVKLRFAQDKPVGIVLPRITRCTVAEILETVEGTDKKYNTTVYHSIYIYIDCRGCVVKLRGGAKVTCSVSLQVGDVINVDTEELTYQGRYK